MFGLIRVPKRVHGGATAKATELSRTGGEGKRGKWDDRAVVRAADAGAPAHRPMGVGQTGEGTNIRGMYGEAKS